MSLWSFANAARRLMRALAPLALAALVTGAASAQYGFSGRLSGELAGPVELAAVRAGAPLQGKADEYGSDSVADLVDDLNNELRRALNAARVGRAEGPAYQLRVVLVDAKPNRPTFTQLGRTPGLSPRSLYRGGAQLEATVYGPNGAEIGSFTYRYETRDLRDSAASATWTDARRAMRNFSDRLARRLADSQPGNPS